MIMPFDIFGDEKYRYTFKYRCEENSDLYLEDGATKIFINTKGKNEKEVPKELIDFLKYVENSSELPIQSQKSEKLKRIQDRVSLIKQSEEMGVRYMQDWEEKVMLRQEGKEEGIKEGIRLFVVDNIEENIPRERIVEKLKRHYKLSEEEEKRYIQMYEK